MGAPLRSRRSVQRIGTPTTFRGLRSRRSDALTGQSTEGDEFPFRVRRCYDGVQLLINWTVPPVGASEIILIKKWGSWAQNITDGVVLVRDESPFSIFHYSDQEVEAYEVYYYSLFAKRASDSLWIVTNRYRGKEFPIPTRYFEGQLWKRLPSLYHREDGE